MKHPLSDISAAELKEKLGKGEDIHLLDVREQLEFHTYNIGGQNLPLGNLSRSLEDLDYNKDDEIVVICQRGLRSETGRRILAAAGYTRVYNLEGGLLAYRRITE
jgi:rhodanese-related sulfurtransferase